MIEVIVILIIAAGVAKTAHSVAKNSPKRSAARAAKGKAPKARAGRRWSSSRSAASRTSSSSGGGSSGGGSSGGGSSSSPGRAARTPKRPGKRAAGKTGTPRGRGRSQAALGGLLGGLLGLLAKALRDSLVGPDADEQARRNREEMRKAKAEGRTFKTSGKTEGVKVEHRSPWAAFREAREDWTSTRPSHDPPADPDAPVLLDPPPAPSPHPDPDAPPAPEPPPARGEGSNHRTEGDSPVTTPNGAAIMGPGATNHLQELTDFEPESEADVLGLFAGEATFDVQRAEAFMAIHEMCVTTIGLDPTAMEQLMEASESVQAAAEQMSLAYGRFFEVYKAVMETVSSGTVLPYNGRFMTGEAA